MSREPGPTPAQLGNTIAQELRIAGNRRGILELEHRYRAFMAENFPEGDGPRPRESGTHQLPSHL